MFYYISVKKTLLFVQTIEKVIILCTVLTFFLSGSFEDMGIFRVFRLKIDKYVRENTPSKVRLKRTLFLINWSVFVI